MVYLDTTYYWKHYNKIIFKYIVPWDPILKKNLLKSVVAGLVNIAQDLHKKCSCQHKCKRVCIQTNTNNLLLHLFFFFQLLFFMFLLNHVFHSVLTFLFLTVPLDYFSQTQILHIFFLLCFKQRWTANYSMCSGSQGDQP